MEMRRFHINVRRFCVALVGLVFFVSGMLKLMDPVGVSLIVEEYLRFFHAGWMGPAAKGIGLALSLTESLCGVAMLCGVLRRVLSYVVLVMVGGFTLITSILLIFNPPMDCGCFGEAIHLTHVQSFVKNVILLALAVAGFVPVRSGQRPRLAKFVTACVAAAVVLAFAVVELEGLPVVDFTDYAPGAEDFSLSFTDSGGQYADSLAVSGDVLVVSAYAPQRLSWRDWEDVSVLFGDASAAGMTPLLLSVSMDGVPQDLVDYAYLSDYRQLITLNRSNGGSVYISDGMVVDKWTRARPCTAARLEELMDGNAIEAAADRTVRGRITLEAILLGGVAAMLLI